MWKACGGQETEYGSHMRKCVSRGGRGYEQALVTWCSWKRRRARDHHQGSSLRGASPQGSSPREKMRKGLRGAVRSAPEKLKVRGLLTDCRVQTLGVFLAVWLWWEIRARGEQK